MQYPLHLLNLSSVRDFEAKVAKDEALRVLDPRRFRANLIGELFPLSAGWSDEIPSHLVHPLVDRCVTPPDDGTDNTC